MIMNAAVPAWVGSSPLARGLLDPPLRASSSRRIIPARAGFTQAAPQHRVHRTDHPRSRGVYPSVRAGPGGMSGSSPLARGLPLTGAATIQVDGIIPARAGFTGASSAASSARSDHPRSRGVYAEPDPAALTRIGSSPLARGLHSGDVVAKIVSRIIPARAGFTARPGPTQPGHRDHPRSRGVYASSRSSRSGNRGSSPLARGLRPGGGASPSRLRGSSPLARGLQEHGVFFIGWSRIIPARAGFTSRSRSRPCGARIIPARAGFTRHPGLKSKVPRGSSPLARGLPPRLTPDGVRVRIIPARAGFTR